MSPWRAALWRALAGLETGVTGALLILGWLVLVGYWQHGRPWLLVNLLASPLAGEAAFRVSFSRLTVTAMALQVFASGAAGAALGLALPASWPRFRTALTGMASGYLLYQLCRRAQPLLYLYGRPGTLLLAGLLWGAWWTRYPRYYHRLLPQAPVAIPVAAGGAGEPPLAD